MSASWLQLSLKAPAAALDTIANFLIERGSPGVVLKKNEVRAFFARSTKRSALKRDIQRFLRAIRGIYPEVEERAGRWTLLKERNWNSSWRRFFFPQKIGRSLWITPPWIDPPETDRKVIVIEPAMAFGTGTHPTTRSCLEFLEEVHRQCGQERIIALDVGTGSGILAIALAKLGAKAVLALDKDPVALQAARANIRRNRVGRVVKLATCGLGSSKEFFHVVVANLTAESLIDLAPLLGRRVAPKGYLILSGILRPKAPEVVRQFCPGQFILTRQKRQKEWTTLLFRKGG